MNRWCLYNGATLQGRVQAARWLLQRERLVPVHVHTELLLIPTRSMRDYDCVLFNYFALPHSGEHPKVAAFLITPRGQNALRQAAHLAQILGQDYDIIRHLKGSDTHAKKDHPRPAGSRKKSVGPG